MGPLTKLALGGSLATAVTVTGLVVGGVFAGGAVVVADPVAVAARADGLLAFDDCDALRDWYVDRALEDVGPYGWGDPTAWYSADLRGSSGELSPLADAAAPTTTGNLGLQRSSKSPSQASSATGTNTQEADVDEPDTVKTNGRLLVRLVDNRTLTITDVRGAKPRELSRVTLPGRDFYGAELLLVGNHVLALATEGTDWIEPRTPHFGPGTVVEHGIGKVGVPAGGTKVLDVDISDPRTPRLDGVDRYTGRLVSARQYGDTIRLVTATARPELPWFFPGRGISADEATDRNAALVRATTVQDWLPSVKSNGRTEPLLGCDKVLHPHQWAGAETIAVTTFAGDDLSDRRSVGITADAQVAYSSGDRLYLASARLPGEDLPDDDGELGGPLVLRNAITRTDLHSFALDGAETTYVASGTIAGDVRDRWSLDEDGGVLRVAWTRLSSQDRNRNGIITMTERDGHLVRVGQLRGLGVDEQIQAVRWFGDLAVLVTFRQVDPLYTIDLADPAEPVARGALKVPGYSGYLHPIGKDRLLGLGLDATSQGRTTGAQAATFDIADLTDPRRLGQVGFGSSMNLPAVEDPRGFTWLPGSSLGLTTVADSNTGKSRLVGLDVSDSGDLTSRVLATGLQGYQSRTLPLGDGRIALVDQGVPGGVRILDLS